MDVMSQAAAVLCIQLPVFDTTLATHRARKTDCRKGLHAETAFGRSSAEALFTFLIAIPKFPFLCFRSYQLVKVLSSCIMPCLA
jgi:hypothetical protein